jgi:hypothetical protein
MKPPRNDHDRCLTEQCWLGIGCLLVWAVLIMGLARCCGAELPPPVATIRVEWTQPEPSFLSEEAIQWKIYRTFPLPRVQIAVTEVTHAYITVAEGEKIVVTACGATKESKDSVEWTVRLPYPDPVIKVTVQVSKDAKDWTDHQTFEFRKSNTEFYRLKIERSP